MTIWKLEYLTPLSIGVAKMMNYQIDKQYLKELKLAYGCQVHAWYYKSPVCWIMGK